MEILQQTDDDTIFFPIAETSPPIRTNNTMTLVVPFRERNTTYILTKPDDFLMCLQGGMLIYS